MHRTMTAYQVQATGRRGYKCMDAHGRDYVVHESHSVVDESKWYCIQLFGNVGCIAGEGPTPEQAFNKAAEHWEAA